MFDSSFYRDMGVILRAWIGRRIKALREKRRRRLQRARRFKRFFEPQTWVYPEALESRVLLSASIQGTLFNDFDRDGAKDTGEDGLADWTVFVDQNANSELDSGEVSDVTGADGAYTLSGLSSGSQSVVILTPGSSPGTGNWSGTTPSSGVQSITLDTNENRTDVDFGVSFVSVVDNSDESFVATDAEGESAPQWQSESSGFGDDAVSIETGVASGGASGGATAVWTFENLTPGRYRVSVTWPTLTGLSDDARFVVADADREVELRAIRVDQSESPGSSPASFHDSETDADWQNLGDAVMVGGTSLIVTLDNSTLGDGGIVAADAVRIERVGALDEAPILRLTDGDSDVSPEAAFNFGDTVMGSPVSKTFVITNTGLDDLVFDGVPTLPEGFTLAWNLDGDTPGGTLAPGNSATFVIYLDGGYTGTPGSFSGDFSFTSNAGEEPFTLALSGSVSAVRSADDSDDAFTATDAEGESAPTWQNETTGYGNTSKSIEVGDGSATAVWTFEGLTPGLYRVSVTWPSDSGLATDVTYTIEDVDLNVTLATTEIDQTSAPGDLSELGTDWEDLAASVELCGYTLRVTLTNEAPDSEGATIIADAVRVERVGDLDTTLYLLDVPEESTEGDPITPYAVITGSAGQWLDPALYTFDWTVTKDEVEFATSTDADFSFTPDDEGTYVISLIVTLDEENSGGGPTYTSSATIEVANAEPTLTLYADANPVEGTEFTLNLYSYDPGDDTITGWTIDWGDGPPEVVTGNPDTITHTYAEGPLEVTITATATDEDGTFDAESLTVTVANAAPTASFDLTDTVSEGQEATFAFTNANDLSTGDATAGYTYSYDFDGDGTFDIVDSPDATATHTFADSGTYFVIGRITDRDGDSSLYVAEIEVGNIGPTLTVSGDAQVTQGDTYSLTLAADDDGVDAIGRWVIDWGDGFIQAVAGTPEDPITHVYRNSGGVTIHVTAKDEDGTYQADPLDITVNNVAPTIDVTPVASDLENVQLGSPLNLLLQHEDPGYEPVGWTIDWGDGHVSRSSGEDATPDDFGIGFAHHAYSQPGDYTITVTANDGTGDSESQQIELTVVTLLAPAPYALDATWQTDNTVDLEWHQSTEGPYTSSFDVEWRRSDESWAGHTATFAANQDSNDPTLWSCNSSSFPLGLPLLPDGVDYEFRVRAHDTALGGGPWSVPASVSTPEAPTLDAPENFEMVQLQMQMLPTYFQWDDVDDESGYAVEIHSDDAPGDGWVVISGVYADSTSSDTFAWTMAPIWAAWPSLDIRVRAFVYDNGFYYYSDSSNVITYSHPGDDVDMPELTIAAVGSDFVTLDYDISQGDYYVVRAIDNVLAGPEAYDQYWYGFGSDYNWTQLDYSQTEITLYRPNRWADTFYAVGSYNGDGYPRFAGYITVPADATPAPENLTAAFDEDGRLTLTWDQPEGTDGYLTEFEIAANDNTFVYFTQFGPASEGANTYVLTPSWITGEPDTYPLPYDLPAGLTYAFRARTTLDTIAYSPYSSVTAAAAQQPPQAPTALTARVVAFDSIQLLWQDNAHNETGFVIEYSTDETFNTGVETIDDLDPNTTAYLVTGLDAGETYYFRVKAVNGSGDSDYSESTSAIITLPNVTIDSNNDSFINEEDDAIEDDANLPGEWLAIGEPWQGFDFDGSLVLNWDDISLNQDLYTIHIAYPEWMDPELGTITFDYQGSNLGSLGEDDELTGIALLTSNSSARTLSQWLEPGQAYSLASFGLPATPGLLTAYVLLLNASVLSTPTTIQAHFNPLGSESAATASDSVTVSAAGISLRADSDNNNGFGDPDASPAEERLKDVSGAPGKVLQVNDRDVDRDGLIDWMDFDTTSANYGLSQPVTQFVPLVVGIAGSVDTPTTYIRFTYDSSAPEDAATFNPSSHATLRIWDQRGGYYRNPDSIDHGGNYVPSGTILPLSAFTIINGQIILYVEAISGSTALGDVRVVAELLRNGGTEVYSSIAHDALRFTAHSQLIAIDTNRDGQTSFGADDTASVARPYQFWVNSDSDQLIVSDYNKRIPEYVDIIPSSSAFSSDAENTTIESLRDLEDFSHFDLRLPSYVTEMIRNDPLHRPGVRLTVSDGDGRLKIANVPQSIASAYLSDTVVAKNVVGRHVQEVPSLSGNPGAVDLWDLFQAVEVVTTSSGSFLFEGTAAGTCTLTFSIVWNEMVIGESAITIKFRDIKDLYEIWTPGGSTGPNGDTNNWGDLRDESTPMIPTTVTRTSDSGSASTDGASSSDYILLVHGVWMTPEDRRSYAETMYKRLFWLGYQGHVGLFSWPTNFTEIDVSNFQKIVNVLSDMSSYNRSEHNAWNSASAMLSLLKSLSTQYGVEHVNVLAHSQGNYVISEALRIHADQPNPSPLIHSYVATQAATPAEAYDMYIDGTNPESVFKDQFYGASNPYANYPYGREGVPANRAYFGRIGLATQSVYNFYNWKDALTNNPYVWRANHYFKPNPVTTPLYIEARFDGIYGYARKIVTTGGLGHTTIPLYLNSRVHRYELFAFVFRGRTRALGAGIDPTYYLSRIHGVFGTDMDASQINLGALAGFNPYSPKNFGDAPLDHSAQFQSTIMLRAVYWERLLSVLGIDHRDEAGEQVEQ